MTLLSALREKSLTLLTGSVAYLGNAGKAFLIRVIGAGIGLALQILLARLLSLADYGIYAMFWTWLFVAAQIAALGFNDSCVRFLPRYTSRGRFNDTRAYLNTGYRVVVAGSVAITCLGLSLVLGLATTFPTLADHWILLTLFFVGVPFVAFELYLEGLARSFGWFVLAAAPAYIVRPGVLALVFAAVAVSDLGLNAAIALGIAIAITGLLTLGQAVLIRQKIFKQIGVGRVSAQPSKKHRLWLAASLPLMLVYGIEEIYVASDILILGLLTDPSEVGVYFAAVRLMALAGYVYYAFMLISSREFSLARANLDQHELQKWATRATFWTFWMTIPAVLAIIVLGQPLLALFGADYVAGYGALTVLGIGLVVRASVGQAGDLLIVLGHQRDALVVAVICLGVNALLAVALVPVLGILGAAISTTCSQVVRAAALSHCVRRRANVETLISKVPRLRPQSELRASG